MANENWHRVKEIFADAVGREPKARWQFLEEVCADDADTRREVESLLSSLDDAGNFLDSPAVGEVADVIHQTNALERGKCFGHYEIIEQIGAGGMGEVYLAKDKKLDRSVAVKILNEKFAKHESNLIRFVREAKAASALNHPNILVIHEIGAENNAHFIVSEFIKGETLRGVCKRKTLRLSEVLDISIQIAGALTAAHEAHLIHRDIKPENIMIRPDGYVKILDFGLAKLVEHNSIGFEDATVLQNQTAKGIIMGTVNYMSPEQAKGERVDAATDIFSFGVVLYEMLAGRTPFAGDSLSETFANLINAEPPPLSSFSTNIPDELQRIVAEMLCKKKDERFLTMRGLLTELKVLQKRIEFETELGRISQPDKQAEAETQISEDQIFEEITSIPPNNLTGSLSPVVGREKEISHIKNLLSQTDVQMVTLSGIGGTGKTRLAKAVAQEMIQIFPEGVFFIELAAITNHELAASTIAQSLGIKEAGGKPILEILKDYLHEREMLLVLDNFEQVAAAAPMIAELLAAAGNLKILITSRVLLRLSAEREFIVPPLAVPDETSGISLDDLSNYEAIRLFVERARNAKPSFALTNENAGDVAKICARLDGLPLAIELGAARIKILSPRMILTKLENRLKLLTGGASDLPVRQQTMRDAIEWSYDLLTNDEKHLFHRLAVFAGGFTFEAAEAICSRRVAGGSQEPSVGESVERKSAPNDSKLPTAANRRLPSDLDVLDLITSLVDKSLLVSKERANDTQRFRMLEMIREYALETLEKSNEAEAMRRSHAMYFLALGEEADLHLQSAQAGEWLDRLEDDHDNLRAAILWLFENDTEKAARLVAAIRIYLVNHSHLAEGREWLETALKNGGKLPETVRFKLLNGLGYLAFSQGDYAAAQKLFESDLAEGKTTGDKKRIAESLRGLGAVAHSQDDFTAARKFHEEGLAIHRELNDKFGIAKSLNGLGALALNEGKTATAGTLLNESLANFRLVGNESGICYCLLNLGLVAQESNDYEAARKYYSEVIIIAQKLGYQDRFASCLDKFAVLAAKRGEWELAVKLTGMAERLREQIGYESEPIERQRRKDYLAELKAKMDESVFIGLYKQGRKLKLEEAVALCLEENNSKIHTIGDKPFEEYLEKSHSPDAENATKILQATAATGGINNKTAETDYAFTRQIKRHKSVMFTLLPVLIVVSIGIAYIWHNFIKEIPMNFQTQKLTRLTAVGKAVTAAISPDGKYVVYVLEDGGQQSLWLRHIASESTVQLLPPDKNKFSSVQFSPDSNHVYYNSKRKLYQIPVLGGTPVKVLDDMKGGITFSPDAKQIAFRRIEGANFEINPIIIADADGTNQRQLISREDIFDSKLAWSPDGKVIACVRLNREKFFNKEILAVQVADGTATLIPSPLLINIIGQMIWMPDGKSLMIAATNLEGDEIGLSQIRQVDYPSGETRSITKDLSNYTNVSITSDGHSLVSVKLEQETHLWTMPADNINRLRQITFGSNKYDGLLGISWMPDGRIVYDSSPDRKSEVWVVGADGNNSRQLATNAGSPGVSPDGRYLVYQYNHKEKVGLWRMDLKDGSKKQLTRKADLSPNFSPDGKWVIYQGYTDQNPPVSLYKVSIDGGEIVQLTKNIAPFSLAVSPDGKQIAFTSGRMEDGIFHHKISIMPFGGGEVTKMFDVNLQGFDNYGGEFLQWTPDGKAINYVGLDNGISNIWRQPIDGSAPMQFTNFSTDRIFNFAFSPDGSQIAFSRGNLTSDVVLIENIK